MKWTNIFTPWGDKYSTQGGGDIHLWLGGGEDNNDVDDHEEEEDVNLLTNQASKLSAGATRIKFLVHNY